MTKPATFSLFFLHLLFLSFAVHSDTLDTFIDPLKIPVKTTDGRIFTLSELTNNKPVYLKFWATWCQPCIKQMPHLQATFEKQGHNIDIIAVNLGINDNNDAVIRARKEFGLTLPIVIDHTAKLSQKLGLIATPYHILLDKNRNIVFKGHDTSDKLEHAIKLLAENDSADLPIIKTTTNKEVLSINTETTTKPTIIFFSSAWCDWYLEKSRPKMSSNCINAQNAVNNLYRKYPNLNWSGVLTQLWTGKNELDEYKKKFNIVHPVAVDTGNKIFIRYGVKNFPTLIAISNGKELFRLQNFNDPQLISSKFEQLNALK